MHDLLSRIPRNVEWRLPDIHGTGWSSFAVTGSRRSKILRTKAASVGDLVSPIYESTRREK
jgi:hypothetical protein